MNLAQAQSRYDNSYDVEAERNARSEAREEAIRQSIESDPELFEIALLDYYASVTETDGADLLIQFTLALIAAEPLMDKIGHGDPLCDSDNYAFRMLCDVIEEAKRRKDIAIDHAVEWRVS